MSSAEQETREMSSNSKLDQILDQFLNDLQQGQACSRSELLAQHPDLADELAECLDGIEMVAGLGVGSDLVPQQLGDFWISEPIGQGAMGIVYRAEQISLKRPVALKVLRYTVSGKQASKRFEREAELVATLEHPHIVPVFAFDQHENLNYFAMQLIDGESLAQWSAQTEVERDPKALATWAAQVARALGHAHGRDVVHRDVKPSNLLKDKGGKIWLTDFGLARRFDDVRMSMTGAMLGTPNYMSPEQASPGRHPIDHRTDIYSLGATLFELLTGRTVFQADTPHAVLAQVLTAEAPTLSESIPNCSRDLETILIKCLEQEPFARYQTADELADDLESFAADQSIKARRPSILERASRWRRQNQKAVSWATTAVAAAISILAVGLAVWSSWKNSHQGTLKIDSDEGPIVGRLIGEDGEATPTFSIPAQQEMDIDAGRYQLQMWAGGRFGESQDLFVDRGKQTKVNVKLPDLGVFPSRTVEGIPQAWRRPTGGDAVVLFHEQGITAVDGTTGKDLWTTEAADIIKKESKPKKSESKGSKSKGSKSNSTTEEQLVRPFHWNWIRNGIRDYTDDRIPQITDSFPDVNSDQTADLLVACQKQPILFVLDGDSGKPIWRYIAAPTLDEGERAFQHFYAGCLGQPQVIGDIDNDGVADIAASFYTGSGGRIYRWQDAVSGKTGKRIWRVEMPVTWFDPKNLLLPNSCQITFDGGRHYRHTHSSGFTWQYSDELSFRNQPSDLVVPWPAQLASPAKDSQASTNSLFTVCGSHLISVRSIDGKPGSFNASKPLDLGFFPALAPVLVQDDAGQSIGLLLCEQVAMADGSTNTPAHTRFTMLSIENAKPIWQYEAVCDPGWTDVTPDWPLVKDISGDGIPEIIIADGADLEKSIYNGATCLASLQAIDAVTGKPLWQSQQRAKIRGQDRQVHSLLTGPDADGDSLEDIYIVSPMLRDSAPTAESASIFIDVVSGATGQHIRSTQCLIPIIDKKIDLQTPCWWGTSPDGSPQMLIATKDFNGRGKRQSTFLISTATGELTHIGSQLEHPLLISTVNERRNLLAIKPRSRDNIAQTGQLISIESRSQQTLKTIDQNYRTIGDLNDDGVIDLFSQDWPSNLRVLSGKTGQELWEFKMTTGMQGAIPAGGDADADGAHDFVTWSSFYVSGTYRTDLSLISGKTGQKRWATVLKKSDDFGAKPACYCRDLDVDGNTELLVLNCDQGGSTTLPSLRLACHDGATGTLQWNVEVAPARSRTTSFLFEPENLPIQFADINLDGKLEIICSTFDPAGKPLLSVFDYSGQLLWQRSIPNRAASVPLFIELMAVVGPRHIQSKTALKPQIALASSVENSGQAKYTVSLDWIDCDEGKRTSSWSGEGRLRRHQDFSSEPLGIWHGIPFTVLDRDKAYTGFCVKDRGARKMEIVVLDSSSSPAVEVQRIEVVQPDNLGQGFAWTGDFLIEDINADGRTDMVYHDGTDLIAKTIIDGKEIRRRAIPADWRRLREIDIARQQLLLQSSLDGDARIKLIDLDTFETRWNLKFPKAKFFEALLLPKKLPSDDLANESQEIPHILYKDTKQINKRVVMAGVFDDYLGSDAKIRNSLALPPVISMRSLDADPRMVEPVPWSGGRMIARGMLDLLASALLIAAGAIVFPFLFLKRMFRSGSWSLQTFLLVPLVFVVPYFALQLPLEIRGFSPGQEFAGVFGHVDVEWFGKLVFAILYLPVMVFFWSLVSHLWAGRWKSFVIVVFLNFVVSIAIGALMLVAYGQQLPAGSRFNFADWGYGYLMINGIWIVGFCIVVWRAFNTVGSWVKRLFKQHRQKPKLTGTAS